MKAEQYSVQFLLVFVLHIKGWIWKVGRSNENKSTILGWTLARLCNEVRYMFICIHEQSHTVYAYDFFLRRGMLQEHTQRKSIFISTASKSHLNSYKCVLSLTDIKEALKELDIFLNCHKPVLFIFTMKLCSSYISPTFIQFLMKTEYSFPFSSNYWKHYFSSFAVEFSSLGNDLIWCFILIFKIVCMLNIPCPYNSSHFGIETLIFLSIVKH